MNSVEQLPPTRWAAFAGLGSLLMVSPALFALLKLPNFFAHDTGSGTVLPVRLLIFGGPFLVGLGMAIAAMKRLRDGIRRSVWTEAELEALRRGVRNPAWGVLSGALVVFGIVSVVTDHGFGHAGLLPLVILPFHMRMQIAQVIRPVANSPDRIDWNGSAAIRSERWGEPPSGTVR